MIYGKPIMLLCFLTSCMHDQVGVYIIHKHFIPISPYHTKYTQIITYLMLFPVAQAVGEARDEVRHVLLKVGLAAVGKRANRHKRLHVQSSAGKIQIQTVRSVKTK